MQRDIRSHQRLVTPPEGGSFWQLTSCHDRILRKGATWSKKSHLSFVCTAHNLTLKAPKVVVDILIGCLTGCAEKCTYAPTSNPITNNESRQNANIEL